MIKKITYTSLVLMFFFNISFTKAQYILYYTKSDTLQLPYNEFKLNYSGTKSILPIIIGAGGGAIFGLIIGRAIFGTKGEGTEGVYSMIIGSAVGSFLGIIKSIVDIKRNKNLNYDNTKALIKLYTHEDSYTNLELICFKLALNSDNEAHQFLLKEYIKFAGIKRPYFEIPEKFMKNLSKILALSIINNNYNIQSIISNKLIIEEKVNILNNIPLCINVTSIDSVYNYLKIETDIKREEEYNDKYYLSDAYYEMLTAHLLTRRNEAEFEELVNFYNSSPEGKAKFWLGFALADYKYEGSINNLINMYNTSDNGNLRFYAIQGLMNFDNDKVHKIMEKALNDNYIPPNLLKSDNEERFIIRKLAEEYLEN